MHQNYDILERFFEWLWGYSPAFVKPSLMMSTTDWHSEARHRLVTAVEQAVSHSQSSPGVGVSKCANLRIQRMVLK